MKSLNIRSLQKHFDRLIVNMDELSFLRFCSDAVILRQELPVLGQEIAELVTRLWLVHEDTFTDSRIHDLGEAFSHLEIPDTHVQTMSGRPLEEEWKYLGDSVTKLLVGKLAKRG